MSTVKYISNSRCVAAALAICCCCYILNCLSILFVFINIQPSVLTYNPAQIVYTSAIQGIAGDEPDAMEDDMEPLFKAIMDMPKPLVKESAPLQV